MESKIFGGGGPVVFFHGCPTTPDVLDDLARAAAAAGRRAVVFSMPGYGASPALAGSWTLPELHDALASEIARVAGPGAWLVGFSSGAYHALALAGDARVAGVFALAGVHGIAGAEEAAQFRALADAVERGDDLRPVAGLRFLSETFRAAHPEAVAKVERWGEATSRANLAAELRAYASAPSLLEPIAALEVPVFARVGSEDVAAPPDCSEAIARAAKRGSLEIVPGAGHALPYEDPLGTASAMVAATTR